MRVPRNHPTYTVRSRFARPPTDIAEAIVKIMDDGPQPMLLRKPAKRVRNSAEVFNDTHQAEYENRGQQTTDWVKTVQRHNRAFPVMYDELDRKRSMSRISTGNVRHASNFHQSRRHRRRHYIRGIHKRRHRRHYYFMINKACQYEPPVEEPKSTETFDEQVPECSRKLSNQLRNEEDIDQNKGIGSRADIDHNNSKPSISTYESVVSLTNEPMVAERNYYS